MAGFALTRGDRRALEAVASDTDRSDALRRAQALLWLDDGEAPGDVADRLRVSRQTVYNWAGRFLARDGMAAAARVADAPRGGRPRTVAGVIDPLIGAVFDADPRDL